MPTSIPFEVLRTPAERFADLPDFPFEPRYVEVENPFGGAPLRMHTVDEGPRDAPVVLLAHGEPSWSYLYRKLIPVFADAGLRVVAPDHIGFGKSDKLTERTLYSFEQHVEWLRALVRTLELERIHLVCQDWGGPIALAVLARETARFASAAVGNTMLHTADAELAGRVTLHDHSLESEGHRDQVIARELVDWITLSQRLPGFEASMAIAGATVGAPSAAELAAYDAPFPDERYKAGMRQFPILIPISPNDPGAAINRATWDALRRFERPFLTLFSDSDPTTRGWDAIFRERVPGAKGQPHAVLANAGHFWQEDRGVEAAQLLLDFIQGQPSLR